MAYCRAVWEEPQENGSLKEFELTIPSNWVKGSLVYWPTHLNAKKSFLDCEEPKSSWTSFNLIKLKVTGIFFVIYLHHYLERTILVNVKSFSTKRCFLIYCILSLSTVIR